MTRKLDPQDRSALRNLLLGVVEHCEISRHLIGTMVHTFYRDGIKYGIPAFTFVGPGGARNQQARIGIVAGKNAGDRLSAEVTLELLERLLLQPSIAASTTLRMVPILNPVGLERPDSGATHHEPTEERIRLQSPDGMIEVTTIDEPAMHFTMHADATAQKALELASMDLHRLSAEIDVRLSQTLLTVDSAATDSAQNAAGATGLTGAADAGIANTGTHDPAAWIFPDLHDPAPAGWNLKVGIPRGWGATVAVQLASQFLLSFFRHLERLSTAEKLTHHGLSASFGGYGLSRHRRAHYRS